jgi:hypothetical protein
MHYKAIVYKTNGVCISNSFTLLRSAKLYARKMSSSGDTVRIEEQSEDEQTTLQKYVVDDTREM